VCDHNTVDGYPQLFELCAEKGIKLLPGVETDCFLGDRHVHLLGYGFGLDNPELLAMLSDIKQKMRHQNDAVIHGMAGVYGIDLDEYVANTSPPEIGGYKNSNFLLHKGIIGSIPEFFPLQAKYGLEVKDAGLPQLERACCAIRAAGGFPVLAHPWRILGEENFLSKLQAAVDAGVLGLECYYPDQDARVSELCVDFCMRQNLLITAGSDDHGLFNRVVGGITYEMGEIMVDVERLNLKGLL